MTILRKQGFVATLTALVLLLLTIAAAAEELTVKRFTSADGLANDDVFRIVPDSRGFVWFCTGDGLSRFDGFRFKNYTQQHGLPHRSVHDLIELGDGRYLVATGLGLAIFDPKGTPVGWDFLADKPERDDIETPLFRSFRPPRKREEGDGRAVLSLERTPAGRIFAGTGEALFEIAIEGAIVKFTETGISRTGNPDENFNDLRTDDTGDVWAASSDGVYRIRATGETEIVSDTGGQRVFVERAGRVWIDSGGNDVGIRIFQAGGTAAVREIFTRSDGIETNGFSNAVAQLPDDRILATSNGRLYFYEPNATLKFRRIENSAQLGAVDRSGTVWFTSEGAGVARYIPGGFSVIETKTAEIKGRISSFVDSSGGDVFFTTYSRYVSRVSATGGIETIVPFGLRDRSWLPGFLDIRTDNGDWWIPSADGLRYYRDRKTLTDLENRPPDKTLSVAEGIPERNIFAIFRDSNGFIWISSGNIESHLTRLDPRTGETRTFTAADGLPSRSGAVAFAEDAGGGVWIGFYFGQVLRFADGRFVRLGADRGYVESGISDMMRNDDGSIWFATRSRGVFRIAEPTTEGATAEIFSTKDGLSTNNTQCLTSDLFGRVYVGTSRGINRLDPVTRKIRVFTPADGLAGNNIAQCRRDDLGRLWFSQDSKLIGLVPRADIESAPPPAFIDSISVNGLARAVSELGESEVDLRELETSESRLTITFFAISSVTEDAVQYQWKIGGQEWSAPSGERLVDLSLAPGEYLFEVRAVNGTGAVSDQPAVLRFTIKPAVWRRWWFIALVLFFAGGAVFALDRYRVSKTRQVESALGLLSESETRFRTLADTASDAILTIDDRQNVVFANRGVERVFGYDPAEMIGRPIGLVIPVASAELDRFVAGADDGQYLEGLEITGLHKDGRDLPLELSFGGFERDGRRFFTGIARDVSEKKRAEDRLRAARAERINELQRVRSRIATDLHDDIGSSLTQIAVLCEVARGQASRHSVEEVSTPLERIRSVSRELVSVMSDIVWAINPQKDFLIDLVQRMRRFGSDVLPGSGIRFDLVAPAADEKVTIGANIRREVFSIYKESINNAAKYSQAENIMITLSVADEHLNLTIADDGRGFDSSVILADDYKPDIGGNGLRNIRRRCEYLGGKLEIRTATDEGTTISIKIPLSEIHSTRQPPPE